MFSMPGLTADTAYASVAVALEEFQPFFPLEGGLRSLRALCTRGSPLEIGHYSPSLRIWHTLCGVCVA